jgi:hypothetical protein
MLDFSQWGNLPTCDIPAEAASFALFIVALPHYFCRCPSGQKYAYPAIMQGPYQG